MTASLAELEDAAEWESSGVGSLPFKRRREHTG